MSQAPAAGSRDAWGRRRSSAAGRGARLWRAGRDRRRSLGLALQMLAGIGRKLLTAPLRTEIVGPTIVRVAMLGGVRVHRHAAHWIVDALLRLPVHTLLSVVHVCVRFMNRHGDPSLPQVPSGGIH